MLKAEQIKKLQKLQNRCISLISNKGATNTVYQSLKIMRIPEIIKLHNLKLGFKVQHSQLPANVLAVCTTDAKKMHINQTSLLQYQEKKRTKSSQTCE